LACPAARYWDSTALVSFIVLAESNNANISPEQIVGCSTVADLLRLAEVDGGVADGPDERIYAARSDLR